MDRNLVVKTKKVNFIKYTLNAVTKNAYRLPIHLEEEVIFNCDKYDQKKNGESYEFELNDSWKFFQEKISQCPLTPNHRFTIRTHEFEAELECNNNGCKFSIFEDMITPRYMKFVKYSDERFDEMVQIFVRIITKAHDADMKMDEIWSQRYGDSYYCDDNPDVELEQEIARMTVLELSLEDVDEATTRLFQTSKAE